MAPWKRRVKHRSKAQQQVTQTLGKPNPSKAKDKENVPSRTLKVVAALKRKVSGLKDQILEGAQLLKAQVAKTSTVSLEHKNSRRRAVRMEKNQANLQENLLRVNVDNSNLVDQVMDDTTKLEQVISSQEAGCQTISQLKSETALLKKENRALKGKLARSRASKVKAVDRAKKKANQQSRKRERFHLKKKGVVTDSSRELVRELVKIGLSVSHISGAITAVANLLEVEVEGDLSDRSVGRIVLEGGIAAKMQIVEEVKHSQNIAISGDGTTLRNLNYESKHLNYKTTLYEENNPLTSETAARSSECLLPGQRFTRFLGLASSKNHTAVTQVQGWKDTNQDMHDIYNESPRGEENHVNPIEAPSKFTSYSGDHAPDQIKASGLVEEWMIESDRIIRGEADIKTWPVEELTALLIQESNRKLNDAGGIDTFETLSAEEQGVQNRAMFSRVCFIIGEASFAAMSEAEQRAANLFIWAGCCMHKELNAVKGGDAQMKLFWNEQGLTPPIQLMNKDNDAAAAAGPSNARNRALAVSVGGGSKLTALAGAIFNHKDEKKGQGDTFRIFFEAELGYIVSFPDTSNTRYQSHCQAAAALLLHLNLYIKFLEQVRDKKEKRRLNHMEQNVYKGLKDIPTLTELAVLALYGQAISHPYLREVRGPDREHDNILDTGPLHERVKAHCRDIILNPDLLLSSSASYETGSMDGKLWDQPEVFYAVQAISHSLPNLRGALVSFFTGALATWERFTSEFAPGGKIANSSALERERAWTKTTNDDNEGALGELRVGSRRAPNMALHQRNARAMYRRNDTGTYISNLLAKDDLKFLRKKARQLDSSQLEKQRRQAQAKGDKEVVEVKRAKDRQRAVKKKKEADEIDLVVCRFDVAKIKDTPGNNRELDLEISWFRRIDTQVPIKSKLGNKKLKVDALCAAVERYNAGITQDVGGESESESDRSQSESECLSDTDIDSDADMELGY